MSKILENMKNRETSKCFKKIISIQGVQGAIPEGPEPIPELKKIKIMKIPIFDFFFHFFFRAALFPFPLFHLFLSIPSESGKEGVLNECFSHWIIERAKGWISDWLRDWDSEWCIHDGVEYAALRAALYQGTLRVLQRCFFVDFLLLLNTSYLLNAILDFFCAGFFTACLSKPMLHRANFEAFSD